MNRYLATIDMTVSNHFLEMNRSVLFFVLSTIFKIIIDITQSGEFVYRGNKSYSDVSLLISESGPDYLCLRYCAAECHKNVDCNAVECVPFQQKIFVVLVV